MPGRKTRIERPAVLVLLAVSVSPAFPVLPSASVASPESAQRTAAETESSGL